MMTPSSWQADFHDLRLAYAFVVAMLFRDLGWDGSEWALVHRSYCERNSVFDAAAMRQLFYAGRISDVRRPACD